MKWLKKLKERRLKLKERRLKKYWEDFNKTCERYIEGG